MIRESPTRRTYQYILADIKGCGTLYLPQMQEIIGIQSYV